MVNIKNIKKKDAGACVAIANEAFSDEIERGMNSFTEEYFENRVTMKGVKLVVAEEELVLGFMLITDANVFVPAQLHLIAINKQDRGRGIGKKLVQYAIDYMTENGWEKLKLSTRPWNTAMRKICMHHGFTEEALLRKEYLGEDLIQYGYFPTYPKTECNNIMKNKNLQVTEDTKFRVLKPEEADRLLELLQKLSEEATKWSMAPYKLEWVQRWLRTPKLYHVAAEKGDKLIGFVCIEEWTHPRRKGTGYFGVYIHKDYENTDLLPDLIKRVLDKAHKKGLHKVNTEIIAERENSIKTLERHGFQKEGRKRDTFYGEDNQFHDTVIMGKILEN